VQGTRGDRKGPTGKVVADTRALYTITGMEMGETFRLKAKGVGKD
jgi:hypothetical protein